MGEASCDTQKCYEPNILKRHEKEFSDITSIQENQYSGEVVIRFKDASIIFLKPRMKSNERSISAIVESVYHPPPNLGQPGYIPPIEQKDLG